MHITKKPTIYQHTLHSCSINYWFLNGSCLTAKSPCAVCTICWHRTSLTTARFSEQMVCFINDASLLSYSTRAKKTHHKSKSTLFISSNLSLQPMLMLTNFSCKLQQNIAANEKKRWRLLATYDMISLDIW